MKKKKKKQPQSERSRYFLTVQRASANLDILLTRVLEDVYFDRSGLSGSSRIYAHDIENYHRDILLHVAPFCEAINNILFLYNPPVKRE